MNNPERPPQGKTQERRKKGRVVKSTGIARFLLHPVGKAFLWLIIAVLVAGSGVFIYYYQKYARLIDSRLRGGPNTPTSRIYAAPVSIAEGDPYTAAEIAVDLRRAGYSENHKN